MQIKAQQLAQQVQKNILPLYVLVGDDHYLLEESLSTLKKAIKKQDCEEKSLHIESPEDWHLLEVEANSYSLFSHQLLLSVFFDKKSMDALGKKVLTDYLNTINPTCFIIIKAPHIPPKQLAWLSAQELAAVCVAYPLTAEAMKNWIRDALQKNKLSFEHEVPDLIYQYTEGNMLASAQVIEKITLANPNSSKITVQQAQEQLSFQCEHTPFELAEMCLSRQSGKAIQILRQAAQNKTAATLVLWLLSQEIRLLMQLQHALAQNLDFKQAALQLKIWPKRIHLYQRCVQTLKPALLQQLHATCCALDEQIKSHASSQTWNRLEQITLSLCCGDACNT